MEESMSKDEEIITAHFRLTHKSRTITNTAGEWHQGMGYLMCTQIVKQGLELRVLEAE